MPQHTTAIAGSQTITTTAETVVGTTSAFNVANPQGQGVRVNGTVNILAGTGTTAVVVRVRQDSLTGSVVGSAKTHTLAAGASASIAFDELDTATLAATGKQYVVTVQPTAASGNSTVNGGAITADTATAAA